MTQMTEQDIVDGRAFADRIIAMIDGVRPPAAVAGVSLALAAVSVLAECGPKVPIVFFETYYKRLSGSPVESLEMRATLERRTVSDLPRDSFRHGYEIATSDPDAARMRVAVALGELGLVSVVDFVKLSLTERQRILDAIIRAATGA